MKRHTKMMTHVFTRFITLPDETAGDDGVEALVEAGCDDRSPGVRDGMVHIDFHREAKSLEAAVRSACRPVRSTGCDVPRLEVPREEMELWAV